MKKLLCVLPLLFIAAVAFGYADSAAATTRFATPAPPPVDARSVIIVDMANGDVLYESEADVIIPPASLTKIMSLMIALDAIESGIVSLDQRVTIEWNDVNLPYRSSLMYLRDGMSVPMDDLLRGMAVVSGNDAARTVARVVAGSSEAFVDRMNAEALRLGLKETRFVEPSGLSELNTTTAREMAILAREYMRKHPEAIIRYHSNTSMVFPRADVMPPGEEPPETTIVLRSTNGLLFSYDGCDGLKTGFIDESGYNLVATAERNGTRVISVSLGGVGGPSGRERAGAILLDWAFEHWRTVSPESPKPPAVRAWGGATEYLTLEYAGSTTFTVPARFANSIESRLEVEPEVEAPVYKGTRLGRVVYTSGGHVVRRIDLVAHEDILPGNVFVRVRDSIIRFFMRLFRRSSTD
ncbi:MAG: D-alanyl-D-alanine carboxypeptidase [Spirochaetales bacterium]|nr:D-alanyl-D-alanine carboxypeptidase [Spirochaetales bacterium]